MITGSVVWALLYFWRTWLSTSKPAIPGIWMSSKITSGNVEVSALVQRSRWSKASLPLMARITLYCLPSAFWITSWLTSSSSTLRMMGVRLLASALSAVGGELESLAAATGAACMSVGCCWPWISPRPAFFAAYFLEAHCSFWLMTESMRPSSSVFLLTNVSSQGSATVKVEPIPILDRTRMDPPWARAMLKHTVSPKPIPW
mmetsp:Transcript_95929/g.266497  ORF Transcript_95929/g.266497 Transcript_95929/m.266497 type:complete len:202 (-) Transcript_95929:340-945(-)